MIARIELQQAYSLPPERIEQLRSIIPQIPVVDEAKHVSKWDVERFISQEMMIDMIDQAPLLLAAGFEFTLKAFKGNYFTDLKQDFHRLERELKFVKSKMYDPESNVVAQVHIPNGFLHEVNEVQVVTDYCSDMLQAELNKGWRILAVCPSINQRRPDYVLGRVDPDKRTRR